MEDCKNVRNQARMFSEKTRKIFLYCCMSPETFFPSTHNIAKKINQKYTTVHHHIMKLKGMGLINKYNQVTDEGKKFYKFIVGWDNNNLENCPRRLRAHNIQIRFLVTKAYKEHKEFSTIYEPFTNKRYMGLKAELYGCKVMYYSSKKIVAVIPDIFADTDEDVAGSLLSIVADLKSALEKEFEVSIEGHKIAKITSLHVAVINSIIAEVFLLQGKIIKTEKIHVDGSKGGNEIEAVDKNTALQDVEVLVKYEDLARST